MDLLRKDGPSFKTQALVEMPDSDDGGTRVGVP
jgi:hypothetical protein